MLELQCSGKRRRGLKKKKKKEHRDEEADVHLMVHRAARLRVRNVRLSVKGFEECAGDGLRLFFNPRQLLTQQEVRHVASE